MSVEDAIGEKGNYLTTSPNCRYYFQMVSISQVLSLKSEADKKKFKEEQGLSYKTSYKENCYKALQEQRTNERDIRKYKRLESAEKASLDHYPTGSVERIPIENRRREYAAKKRAFQKKQRELIKKHPTLDRDYGREALDRFRKYDPNADGNKMAFDDNGKASYDRVINSENKVIVNVNESTNNESETVEEVKFIEAKNVDEAEDFVRDKLLIKNCTFKGLSTKNVNNINKQITKVYNKFPIFKNYLKALGNAQELNKKIKARAYELLIEDYKKRLPDTKEYWEKWASKQSKMYVKKVSSNTYAFHLTYGTSDDWVTNTIKEEFQGIYMNQMYFKNDEIDVYYNKDIESGWHPKGTTGASIIVHELGHALDNMIGVSKNNELKLYYEKIKKEIGTGLSRYAETSIKEFLAEGFAEYIESPNPREMALKVGKFYETLYNEYEKGVGENDNTRDKKTIDEK